MFKFRFVTKAPKKLMVNKQQEMEKEMYVQKMNSRGGKVSYRVQPKKLWWNEETIRRLG